MAAVQQAVFKTSLYALGAIHASHAGTDCYIVHFMNPALSFQTVPPAAPNIGGTDTFAIAVNTTNGAFIVDALSTFTVLNTP